MRDHPLEKIRLWMKRNAPRFVVPSTGEVCCTTMVETWDQECATGRDTLDDPIHPAWDIAMMVAEDFDDSRSNVAEQVLIAPRRSPSGRYVFGQAS